SCRYRQFLGDELCLRREHALAEIALARVSRDLPVSANRDPRIQFGWINMRRARIERPLPGDDWNHRGRPEADNQHAGGFEEVAPGETGADERVASVRRHITPLAGTARSHEACGRE